MGQKQKKQRHFWVQYTYFDGWKNEEDQILTNYPMKNLPNNAIFADITYGTKKKRSACYRVYRGEVLSFKKAREQFNDNDYLPNITKDMVEHGNSTESIRALCTKVNLLEKYKKFVKQCKKGKYVTPKEVGIVVVDMKDGIKRLFFLYDTDIVIE